MNPQQEDGIFRKQLRSSSFRSDFRDFARRLKMSQSNKPFKAVRRVSLPRLRTTIVLTRSRVKQIRGVLTSRG